MPDEDKAAEEAQKAAEAAQKQIDEAKESLKPEKNPAEEISAEDASKSSVPVDLGGLFGGSKAPKPEEMVDVDASDAEIPGSKKGGLFG